MMSQVQGFSGAIYPGEKINQLTEEVGQLRTEIERLTTQAVERDKLLRALAKGFAHDWYWVNGLSLWEKQGLVRREIDARRDNSYALTPLGQAALDVARQDGEER